MGELEAAQKRGEEPEGELAIQLGGWKECERVLGIEREGKGKG